MAKKSKKSSKAGAPKPTNVVAEARRGRGGGGKSSARAGWWWENIKSLGGAVLIFLFIRIFFVEAYRIPTGSMIPTLLVGDWLFVNKLAYGPSIPFTHVHLPGYASPHRGDVIVFESPYQSDEAEAGRDPTPVLVKRLIGLPGDTIYMHDGVVYIDGVAQRQGFGAVGFAAGMGSSPDESGPQFAWQQQIALRSSRFGSAPANPTHDNWGPLLIPPAHYFMMGDNRYCSKDSRYWGIVPRENIMGHPLFVYYSYRPDPGASVDPCDGQTSDRPLSFITDIRWSRLGHFIR